MSPASSARNMAAGLALALVTLMALAGSAVVTAAGPGRGPPGGDETTADDPGVEILRAINEAASDASLGVQAIEIEYFTIGIARPPRGSCSFRIGGYLATRGAWHRGTT